MQTTFSTGHCSECESLYASPYADAFCYVNVFENVSSALNVDEKTNAQIDM